MKRIYSDEVVFGDIYTVLEPTAIFLSYRGLCREPFTEAELFFPSYFKIYLQCHNIFSLKEAVMCLGL